MNVDKVFLYSSFYRLTKSAVTLNPHQFFVLLVLCPAIIFFNLIESQTDVMCSIKLPYKLRYYSITVTSFSSILSTSKWQAELGVLEVLPFHPSVT